MDSYVNLSTALTKWLNREGFTEVTDQVETFIAIAQRRIHRECDLQAMEEVTTLSVDAQAEAAPADLLRVKSLHVLQGDDSFEVVGAPMHTTMKYGSTSQPSYYTLVGTNFYFGPPPDQAYSIQLVYYKALPILSPSVATNWFTDNAPEFLLYAALMEASLFMKDDQRAAIWEGRYQQIKDEILKSEERSDKEYGSLYVRSV